jgi:beta-glucosidase/6-phospho-beta-glucosidase/beta-galactosidase
LLDNFEWTLGYSKRFGRMLSISPPSSDGPTNSFHFYAGLANGAALERE